MENHVPNKSNPYQKTIDLETVAENPCPDGRHNNKNLLKFFIFLLIQWQIN